MLSLILIGSPDHFDLDLEEGGKPHEDLEDLGNPHEDLHDNHQIIFVSCLLLFHCSLSVFKHLFPEKGKIEELYEGQ